QQWKRLSPFDLRRRRLLFPPFVIAGDPLYIMSILFGMSLSVCGLMAIQLFIHIKLWMKS
ncbi:hypothetical protein, partial [Aliivibrio fischeri]|uniref:hypothetical protein n=1 Tax=Aliivibrio fischeri TaxID=668 RepID=UPI001F1F93BD